MAIFVAFAWMIEAAEWLGLIETEAQDPDSRAYRLAHQAVSLLKVELAGSPLTFLSPSSVAIHTPLGTRSLECRDGKLWRDAELGTEALIDLGPGGGASFARRGPTSLDIEIAARTDDGGAYDVSLTLPISRAPLDLDADCVKKSAIIS